MTPLQIRATETNALWGTNVPAAFARRTQEETVKHLQNYISLSTHLVPTPPSPNAVEPIDRFSVTPVHALGKPLPRKA